MMLAHGSLNKTEVLLAKTQRKWLLGRLSLSPQHINSLVLYLVFNIHFYAAAAECGGDSPFTWSEQKWTSGQSQGDDTSVWLIRSHLHMTIPAIRESSRPWSNRKEYEWVWEASLAPASRVHQHCWQRQLLLGFALGNLASAYLPVAGALPRVL